MATIRISNLSDRVLISPDQGKTLLRILQEEGIDWMHACGAKGRCTTCKVIVSAGLEHFSADSEAEKRYRRLGALQKNERLACQSTVHGDVVIRVPDEYKLPHVKYSS